MLLRSWKSKLSECPCVVLKIEDANVLAGYVGIGEEHTLFGVDYKDVDGISIHGGVVASLNTLYEMSVDHKVWWLGFDFGHREDISFNKRGEIKMVEDVERVVREVKKLDMQLFNYPRML